jgi:hypothetical protein
MSETGKDILKIVLPFIMGGIGVVCMDLYADFRGVESKDEQIDHFKDYKLSVDSTFNAHNLLFKSSNEKHKRTLSSMKQIINEDKQLTIDMIEIAEDSIITITPLQTDSIRNILIGE